MGRDGRRRSLRPVASPRPGRAARRCGRRAGPAGRPRRGRGRGARRARRQSTVHLLEDRPQSLQRPGLRHAHRAGLLAEQPADLLGAEPAVDAQLEQLAIVGVEPVERRAHGGGLGAGDGVVLRTALGEPVGPRATSRSVRRRPRDVLVDDVAGDAEEPGVEPAALPREAVDAVEGPGHRLAHDVLGGPVVEQAAAGEPEQRPVRTPVQRLPGVGVAAVRPSDEVAQLLIRAARSRSSSHRCHDVRAPSWTRRRYEAGGWGALVPGPAATLAVSSAPSGWRCRRRAGRTHRSCAVRPASRSTP